MTIHSEHPFATPEGDRDQVRRLRGRVGGVVTLWTAGSGEERAGLPVTSVMVAAGPEGRLLALIDPDSDLADQLAATGRAMVHVLSERHRDLAEAFAGLLPAPGGVFRLGAWEQSDHGPRLVDATAWALDTVEDTRAVGWSTLVTATIDEVQVGAADEPLVHRGGRYIAASH